MLEYVTNVDWSAVAPYIAVGFAAQLVDGALGMAFGVICSTLLVSVMGVAPARASAGVHFVEMFTTGASGISHVLHKNVDWKLFSRIAIPGVIGGCTGAYLLANIHTEAARPFVMGYLTLIGFYLLYKAWNFTHEQKPRDPKVTMPLGLIGGFLDASGGGGWGPVVTSNLLIQGADPRKTIGTVNTVGLTTSTSLTLNSIGSVTQSQKIGPAAQQEGAPERADLAASTQAAIVEVLVKKSMTALKTSGMKRLVVAGGVGANRELRAQLNAACAKAKVRVHYPELHLCTDNGAMIAMAAAMRVQAEQQTPLFDYSFDVKPRWPLSHILTASQ